TIATVKDMAEDFGRRAKKDVDAPLKRANAFGISLYTILKKLMAAGPGRIREPRGNPSIAKVPKTAGQARPIVATVPAVTMWSAVAPATPTEMFGIATRCSTAGFAKPRRRVAASPVSVPDPP